MAAGASARIGSGGAVGAAGGGAERIVSTSAAVPRGRRASRTAATARTQTSSSEMAQRGG